MIASPIAELRARQLHIPFKTIFRHASAERAETSSIWVEAVSADGHIGFGESCPRPYVTSETPATAERFIAQHSTNVRLEVTSVDALRSWAAAHAAAIDANPAAWCALELSLLDLFAKRAQVPVERLLGVPSATPTFRYTAVIGDGSLETFAATAERYRRLGFIDFKVKLSPDREADCRKLEVMGQWGMANLRVRVDANNLFKDVESALRHLRSLPIPLFAVEEPVAANRYGDLAEIASVLGCRIVLDESVLRSAQLAELPASGAQWLVNVRVSKMGGLLRSLEVVNAARALGHGVIVGAQVGETSLLTRAALTVAIAAGPGLIAQEGAFGTHLLSYDVSDAPLMFGPAGVLDAGTVLDLPGFGLAIVSPP